MTPTSPVGLQFMTNYAGAESSGVYLSSKGTPIDLRWQFPPQQRTAEFKSNRNYNAPSRPLGVVFRHMHGIYHRSTSYTTWISSKLKSLESSGKGTFFTVLFKCVLFVDISNFQKLT